MFDGFPSAANTSIETITRLAEATLDFSIEALGIACDRFANGDVPNRDNPRMPPSSSELVPQLRMIDAGIRLRDGKVADTPRLVVYPIGGEPPDGAVPLGPIAVNFGHGGTIDMRDMTPEQKEAVLANAGAPPVKRLARPLPRLLRMGNG